MFTVIINDGPYGSERPYNALRYALALVTAKHKVRLFLLADAVLCAQKGQLTPNGFYNIERLLKALAKRGVDVCT